MLTVGKTFVQIPSDDQKTFGSCLFTRIDLKGARFNGLTFIECHFEELNLDKCTFTNCIFVNCVYKKCSMSNLKITKSTIKGGETDDSCKGFVSYDDCIHMN